MNLGNEVTVKNFHVLTSNHTVTVTSNDGKVYFKVDDSRGNGARDYTTDQFSPKMIKRIRLRKPEAPDFKKWMITVPDTFTSEEAGNRFYTLYMNFTNLYGYGITDRWSKYATISVLFYKSGGNITTAMTDKKFAKAMAAMINQQYVQGHKPIIAYQGYKLVTKDKTTGVETTTYATGDKGSSDNVTYVANTTDGKTYTSMILIYDNTYDMQIPTRRRLEMNVDPQPVEMYLTTNIIDGDDSSWCPEVKAKAEAVDSNGNPTPSVYNGEKDDTKVYKNAYLIWGLEKVSQMKSTMPMADTCSGFIGWDSEMDSLVDSEMDATNGHNYWVLDIAYETAPKMGIPSARNLKELSFAAAETSNNTAPTILTNILNQIGFGYDSTTHNVVYPSGNQLFTITVQYGSNGTATGGGTFLDGSVITLTATPSTGYHFKKWSDNGTDNPDVTTATRQVTVTANATYKAWFEVDS